MKKALLVGLFLMILVGMLAISVRASLDRGIFQAGSELITDLWFQATLLDAYFGFLTFYVWVFYKEPGTGSRLLWLLAIMTLGNIATSVYALIQLWHWNEADGMEAILLRKAPSVSSN